MPDQTRNLNSVTDFAGTLDSNDRIIMTDNKASLKALTTAILGKAIIEGYTGSSLAGASQSVKSAIDSLNSKQAGANAGGHNSVFRGKNLGTSVTASQWSAISGGTFDDLYIGDYWVINSVTWRIAAFDYWLNCGDTACTTHHAVIVPDSNLLNADGSTTHYMNTSNTTEGGYIGSGFFSGTNADSSSNTAKAQCVTKAQNAFGSSHILTHREYFSNAVTNGYVSGGTWTDSTVDLMNESMVYGNKFFENIINGTNVPAAYTIDKVQLPLFAFTPQYICNRADWWLRSVVSSSHFARVGASGLCYYFDASSPGLGLRPAFGIK